MFELRMYCAGCGDFFHIRYLGISGKPRNIIIDSGPSFMAHNFSEVCKKIVNQEESIDLLCITHYDDDHIGGLQRLLESKKLNNIVRELWLNTEILETKNRLGNNEEIQKFPANIPLSKRQNNQVYERARDQGIPMKNRIVKGRSFEFDGAVIDILGPSEENLDALFGVSEKAEDYPLSGYCDYRIELEKLMEEELTNEDKSCSNRASIVFVFEYAKKKILFTGDAHSKDICSAIREKYGSSCPVKFDMVKLPHHGSARNLSEEWAECIQSSRFLISADGSGHPAKHTIAKLLKWYGKVEILSHTPWWEKNSGFFTEEEIEKYVKTEKLKNSLVKNAIEFEDGARKMCRKEDEKWRDARQYAVYMYCEKTKTHGSGVLYYPGTDDFLYIFTCAHVACAMKDSNFVIEVLIKTGIGVDDYYERKIEVQGDCRIEYLQEAEVIESSDRKNKYSPDAAVIRCKKPDDFVLKKSIYTFENVHSGMELIGIGYPFAYVPDQDHEHGPLIMALDDLRCSAYTVPSGSNSFVIRIEDFYSDPSNKASDLEGYSGSMLLKKHGDGLKICALISKTQGPNARRSRLLGIDIKWIHAIMQNKFHIDIKHDWTELAIDNTNIEQNGRETEFETEISHAERNEIVSKAEIQEEDESFPVQELREVLRFGSMEDTAANRKEIEEKLLIAWKEGDSDVKKIAANCMGDICFKQEKDKSARWYASAVFGREFREGSTEDEWLIPSEEGNPWGLFNLGYAFYYGYGVRKDVEVALNYFSMAKKKGNQYGKWMLKAIEKGKVFED